MRNTAIIFMTVLVLVLFGPVEIQAAHTHAYVSLSDGETAVNASDDDWGSTCSSLATVTLGSASASSSASVTWDSSHPFYLCKTGSTTLTPTTTLGYTSTHQPTYAHPYAFSARMYGEGLAASCLLWLDTVELVVPGIEPGSIALVDLYVAVDGAPLATGHFELSGDGSYWGDGYYIDSFFDVYFDGENWRGEYIGPGEIAVDLPVGAQFEFDFNVTTDYLMGFPTRSAMRGSTNHTVTFGVPDTHTLVDNTVEATLDCQPGSGVVPFSTVMSPTLTNNYLSYSRQIAARIDVSLANGTSVSYWRSGYTNVAAGDSFSTSWSQVIPALAKVIGENEFCLVAVDITPPPWNQPPYAPAGDISTDCCTVVGIAP